MFKHVCSMEIPLTVYHRNSFITAYMELTLFILFLFLERGKGGRKRKRNINVWLPLMRPLLGTWPATQAHALTGN